MNLLAIFNVVVPVSSELFNLYNAKKWACFGHLQQMKMHIREISEIIEVDPYKVLLQGCEAKWAAAKDKSTLQ